MVSLAGRAGARSWEKSPAQRGFVQVGFGKSNLTSYEILRDLAGSHQALPSDRKL
jgi:hypothetical protein